MRKIKFRAWDRIKENFVYSDDFVFHVFRGVFSIPKIIGGNVLPDSRFDVMQYTGLHDRTGKEIYEGDIVKINHPFKNRTYTGEVVWKDYGWGGQNFYFTHFDTPSELFSEGTEYIEVIGNKYEHPELLKQGEVTDVND